MGRIRGTHTSPGIYTKFRDISRDRKASRVGDNLKSGGTSGGSGGGGKKPVVVVDWFFGDKFPAVFTSGEPKYSVEVNA